MNRIALAVALAVFGCGEATLDDREAPGVERAAVAAESVWFSPNVGSLDLQRLFTEPERWPRAREKVGVMQFYAQQLGSDAPEQCPMCGPNLLPALRSAGAFQRLREWGIDVAFEVGSVKHHTCRGRDAAAYAAGLVSRVAASGGQVRYIAMDEPLPGGQDTVSGESCGLTPREIAREVAAFVDELRTREPSVSVGDIEPYPFFTVPNLLAWLDELDRHQVRLAFFHLDVDLNAARHQRVDVAGDLRRLEEELRARGIPMGVILNVHENEIPRRADEAAAARVYFNAAMAWVRTVKAAIGAPDHAIFQSWLESPGGARVVPRNLDERAYSHTRLVDEGADLLGMARRPLPQPSPQPSPDPQPVPDEDPAPLADEAEVKVAHLYLGILGRPADAGGLSGFAAAMRQGLSAEAVCRHMFDSPEFAASRGRLSTERLARAFYRGILGREPEPGGLAETVNQIRAGRRAERAAAMVESQEFRSKFL